MEVAPDGGRDEGVGGDHEEEGDPEHGHHVPHLRPQAPRLVLTPVHLLKSTTLHPSVTVEKANRAAPDVGFVGALLDLGARYGDDGEPVEVWEAVDYGVHPAEEDEAAHPGV